MLPFRFAVAGVFAASLFAAPVAAQSLVLDFYEIESVANTRPAADDLGIFRERLDALFGHEDFRNAHWGVMIESLDGQVLYSRNETKGFMPASTLKLFTTAAAAEILGPGYTYETTVDLVGTLTEDGRLIGDVVIVGSGDPSLGAWHPDEDVNSDDLLADWVEQLRAAGITAISGDIIGDGRIFDEEFIRHWWSVGDLPWWYAAGSSGLAMEENCFRCYFTPGQAPGDPVSIELVPDTGYVEIENYMETVVEGGENTADVVFRELRGNRHIFEGTLPVDVERKRERGAIWNGERYAAYLFMEALEREGIEVTGGAYNIRDLDDPDRIDKAPAEIRRTVITHTSPPMREQLKVINRVSHNFFADMVLRTLGAQEKEEGTFSAGADVVQEWLEELGVPDAENFVMEDGSGLAYANHYQPRQMTSLLRIMRDRGGAGEAFVESLSRAARDGFLKNRLSDAPEGTNVRAKTGFISYARTLAGYLTTPSGEEYVFSMMCNHHTTSSRRVDRAIDDALVELARFGRGEEEMATESLPAERNLVPGGSQ